MTKKSTNIFDRLEAIAHKDKKNLTESTLKACEELGELAQVILPYDKVAGCKHKPTSRTMILEESVDVILCAFAVAYKMGAKQKEIEQIMDKKATKWENNLKKKVNKK